MHYYKLNIPAWNLSTAHLSLEEEAIYFRLVNYYYDTEKPIPEETQRVFRRLRIATHSDIANSILEEYFTLTEKGWAHDKCDDLLKEYRKQARANKSNGAKGGRPRKDAASSITQEKPNGFPEKPTDNPNQEPLTNNQQPLTNIKDNAQALDDVKAVFAFWLSTMGKQSTTKLSKTRESKIKARLKDGYTVDQIKTAIVNCSNSAFHNGQNDNGRMHNDIELICRSVEKLDGFLEMCQPMKQSGISQNNLIAIEGFLNE